MACRYKKPLEWRNIIARLIAKQKLLYYKSPPHIVDLIASNIRPMGGSICDPCAGDGRALAKLGKHLKATTYGNELELSRYKRARIKLDYCSNGPRELLISQPEFNVVFNNPPYDTSVSGNRMELEHMRYDYELLIRGGLAVWIIPTTAVSRDMISFLDGHFKNLRIMRFPDPDYDVFKQVILFGTKLKPVAMYGGNAFFLKEELNKGKDLRVITEATEDMHYYVDGLVDTDIPFSIAIPQINDVLNQVEERGIQHSQTWETLFIPTASGIDNLQPLLQLGSGHTAMAIAAGVVDGMEAEIGGQPHIIKGFTRKVVRITEETEDDVTTKREKEELVQYVSALNLSNGDLTEFNSKQDEFADFLLTHQDKLVETVEREYPPLFVPDRDMDKWTGILSRIHAPGVLPGQTSSNGLLPSQQIRAAALSQKLQRSKAGILVGEPGTGKTCASAAIIAMLNARRKNWKLVVMCPGQVQEKWKREIERVLSEFGVKAHIIGFKRKQADGKGKVRKVSKPLSDVNTAMAEDNSSVLIMSYETAKNDNRWEHAVAYSQRRLKFTSTEEVTTQWYPYRKTVEVVTEKLVRVATCPDCGHMIVDRDGVPLVDIKKMGKKQRKCEKCDSALWQRIGFSYGGRVAMASYLNKRYAGKYMLIIDECHNSAASDSDIGYASMDLISASQRVLPMTGTIYKGKASGIFHILYRTFAWFRVLYEYDEVQRFVEHHGLQETVTKTQKLKKWHSAYGFKRVTERVREIPGVTPGIVTMLLNNTAFMQLSDMGIILPSYTEERIPITLTDDYSQGIQDLTEIYDVAKKDAVKGNTGLLAAWMHAALGWMDNPIDEELERKDKDGEVTDTYRITGVHSQGIRPKEKVLLQLIQEDLSLKRGVGCYFSLVNRRDWMGRMHGILADYGIYSEILRADTVKPVDREKWYQAFVGRCRDRGQEPVLLANGSLMKEGLDLIELPTLVETGIEYRLNDLRQRIHRSYRVTQDRPVRVVFMYWEDTWQEIALRLVASKLQAAMMVDGNLAEGLAAMNIDDDDLMHKLMLSIRDGGKVKDIEWRGMPVRELKAAGQSIPRPEIVFSLAKVKGGQQYSFL